MPSKKYNDDKLVQVYLNPEVKAKLKDRAKKEGRSASQMAATILTFELNPFKP
jgi:hypothetical protein